MRLMKTNVSKFIALVVMGVHCYLFYIFTTYWFHEKKNTIADINTRLILPHVIVHIDLKGAPPKLDYLGSLLPMMKEHGVTGLLMEYEDMFPYEDAIANLSAKNAYGKVELHNFIVKAISSGFEIIPLIQTFGHMEHALKLKEFQHLRENPMHPDSICPSKETSHKLINDMLTQVIRFHNDISTLKHIHIGCDEVFHINECEKCRGRNLPNMNIFVNHVASVFNIVKTLSFDTSILIWDDMLREINPIQWRVTDRIPDVQPVYWDYKPNIGVSHITLLQYHKRFASTWIASAYKGADGRTATLPDLKLRFMNHYSWLNFILGYKFGGEKQVHHFKGIILTGWSRYSHMEPLCELLPTSIPSLILNLLLINKFKSDPMISDNTDDYEYIFSNHLDTELNRYLQCNIPMDLDNFNSSVCTFEGSELYTLLTEFSAIHKDCMSKLFSENNNLFVFTYYAPLRRIDEKSLSENILWANNTLDKLLDIETKTRNQLLQFYSKDVTCEYLHYKFRYLKRFLVKLISSYENYKQSYVWQRNPPDFNLAIDAMNALI